MYKKIAAHPGTRKLYGDKLVAQGVLPADGPDEMVKATARRDRRRQAARYDPVLTNYKSKYAVDWAPFLGKKWTDAADTALPLAEIKRLAERITTRAGQLQGRIRWSRRCSPTAPRWAAARSTSTGAWASTSPSRRWSRAATRCACRARTAARGTFTHRHAVLHDQNREKWDEGTYTPLQHVADGQAPFVVIDSLLSEEAVLGFEYGYASAEPNTLVIWEAQFGDFVNGAQVVIDQFIASGEVKWGRANGLTLMLPHGYEGPGARSTRSARLERFMQLSADNNMQVVQPTSASQIFHVLRRQMVRMFRKPLIIMTPKSLLRAKDATSPLTEFTKGEFKTVIGEQSAEVDAEQGQARDRLLGQGLLRPRQHARPSARTPTSRSCASSSSIRSRTRRSPPS